MKWIKPAGSFPALYADALARPHLLIAGATGSGKSVIINGLIYTALYDSPAVRQFVLIDPKRVELSIYKPLPHTLLYTSEPGFMRDALTRSLDLCDSRYRDAQRRGERRYNGPDLYIIIDELADLLLTDKATKPLLQRLCQIGRAAKIHVIAATQTPISKVLPTEIKCNFDARFALRTRSRQDSRNIMDRPGCETLPAYGQGFYVGPQEIQLYNIPMIPDAELDRMVKYWTGRNCKRYL